MAVMLRILQIPSRVVTGFQSGVYNPISSRNSSAHPTRIAGWKPGCPIVDG